MCGSESGTAYAFQLDEASHKRLETAVRHSFASQVSSMTASWPADELHGLLRLSLAESLAGLEVVIEPTTVVTLWMTEVE